MWTLAQTSGGQSTTHQEPVLFLLINRAATELSDFAIRTRNVGIVNVLEAVSHGWFYDYFDCETVNPKLFIGDGQWKGKLRPLVRVLAGAITSGATEFVKTLIKHACDMSIDSDLPQLVCALTIEELIAREEVRSVTNFVKAIWKCMPHTSGKATCLHYLAATNSVNAMRYFICHQRELIFAIDTRANNRRILTAAERKRSEKALRALFPAVNANDVYGGTAAFYAAKENSVRSLHFLLQAPGLYEQGKKFRIDRGTAPLHVSAQKGSFGCLKLLLDMALPYAVHLPDAAGRTALHYACRGGHISSIQALLEAGADPVRADNSNCTPVHEAFDSQTTGKDISATVAAVWQYVTPQVVQTDSAEQTLLLCAAEHGMLDCVTCCLAWGADCRHREPLGRTALHLASENGHASVVEALLKANSSKESLCALGCRGWSRTQGCENAC